MEALNTYKTEKTLAEQMNERLAEMKMTKAEAALKMNYSRAGSRLPVTITDEDGCVLYTSDSDLM